MSILRPLIDRIERDIDEAGAEQQARIEKLEGALRDIAAMSAKPDNWRPYTGKFGGCPVVEFIRTESNRRIHDHGQEVAWWSNAKVARAALAPIEKGGKSKA